MKVDYLIVGMGLAGLAFAEELEKNQKSFLVFEDRSQNSSVVAGGMYNPVILKRFTPVWNAISQLETALPFYAALENQFNKKYNYPIDIYRVFKSIEEQNNWFEACDKPLLKKYMNPKIIKKNFKGIEADFGYGKLSNTGWIDTKSLLDDYRNHLSTKNKLKSTCLKYSELEINEKNESN